MDPILWPPKKAKGASAIVLYNPNDYLELANPDKPVSLANPLVTNPTAQSPLQLPPKELSSTALLIPPPKKPRFYSPGESRIALISKDVTPKIKQSSELHVPSEPVPSLESQTSSQMPWPRSQCVFPSNHTEEDFCPFPSHDRESSMAPLYSVSGTQRLSDSDEPFNLNLEFPNPRYFHPYKSQKWKKRGTSLTATATTEVKTNKSLTILSKGKSTTVTRPFKHPVYRLNHIPLRLESRYRVPVYLSQDAYDSEMELQMKEMDEVLREHPPPKKIKMEVLKVASGADKFEIAADTDIDSEEDVQEQLKDMNLEEDNTRSSLALLFIDKNRKQKKKLSKGNCGDPSSSETDDEMKKIDDDHQITSEWTNPAFGKSKPGDTSEDAMHHPEVKGSRERGSMEKVIDGLKLGMTIPLRIVQKSVSKVWPESVEQQKMKNMEKSGSGKTSKLLRSKNTSKYNSFQSISKVRNLTKSSENLSKVSSFGASIGNQYQQLGLESNEDRFVQEALERGFDETLETVENCPNPDKERIVSPINSAEDEEIEIKGSRRSLSENGKLNGNRSGENISTSRSEIEVPKTKSPPLLNSLFGLFRRSEEKQRCSDEAVSSLTNPPCKSQSKHDDDINISKQPVQIIHAPNEEKFSIPDTLQQSSVEEAKEILQKRKTVSIKDNNECVSISPSTNPKKVSFLQAFIGFFHRKDNLPVQDQHDQIRKPEGNKDDKKRKTFLEKLGFKTRKSNPEELKNMEVKVDAEKVPEIDKNQGSKVKLPNHTNSVSLMRKKRIKLFEETREFCEDSIMAYRNVLSQAVGPQLPVDPSTVVSPSIINPFGVRLKSTIISLEQEPSLGYKCTVSESVIIPAMSRRKRRLNQSFFAQEEQIIDDVMAKGSPLLQNTDDLSLTTGNVPLKGILKNVTAVVTS